MKTIPDEAVKMVILEKGITGDQKRELIDQYLEDLEELNEHEALIKLKDAIKDMKE